MNAPSLSQLSRLRELSSELVSARRRAHALAGFPGTLPDSFADAYAVQNLSREAWHDKAVGWKVGGVPPDFIEHFGETHLTGPIFAQSVKHVENDGHVDMPVFTGGFAAIEPEFIVELGTSPEHDRLFIGAEIASSPLPAINTIGPIAVICDFGNNNGMIIGPEIPNWQAEYDGPLTAECLIDGEQVGSREVADITATPKRSIAFLRDHAARYAIDLPTGTFISSGAITGIHEAVAGARSRISFGPFGAFELTLVPAAAC